MTNKDFDQIRKIIREEIELGTRQFATKEELRSVKDDLLALDNKVGNNHLGLSASLQKVEYNLTRRLDKLEGRIDRFFHYFDVRIVTLENKTRHLAA